MSIDRDDRDERQARLDWMISEFQNAQRRHLVKTDGSAGASQVGGTNRAEAAPATRHIEGTPGIPVDPVS